MGRSLKRSLRKHQVGFLPKSSADREWEGIFAHQPFLVVGKLP